MSQQFSSDQPRELSQINAPRELISVSGAQVALGEQARLQIITEHIRRSHELRTVADLEGATTVINSVQPLIREISQDQYTLIAAYHWARVAIAIDKEDYPATVDEAIDGLAAITRAPARHRHALGILHTTLLTRLAEAWVGSGNSAENIEQIYERAFAVAAELPAKEVLAPGLLHCSFGRYKVSTGQIKVGVSSIERGIDVFRFNIDTAINSYAEEAYYLSRIYIGLDDTTKAKLLLDEVITTCAGKIVPIRLASLKFQRALLHAYDLDITQASLLAHDLLTTDFGDQKLHDEQNVLLRTIRAVKMGLDGLQRSIQEAHEIRKIETKLLGPSSNLARKFLSSLYSFADAEEDELLMTVCSDLGSIVKARPEPGSEADEEDDSED